MARTRSITSINNEIKKVEEELIKVHNKQEELEAQLLDLQNAKQEIETKQVMNAFEYSGLDVHAVRRSGNRLAIIQNTRNLTEVKPAKAPQSGSGLDIGSTSYRW